MDFRNRRRSSSFSPAPDNDLFNTRAAALAWHQRSSSSENLSDENLKASLCPRRLDLHHPSRYNLEALRSATTDLSKKPESHSSLLDFYEIESITRELDRFIIRAAANKNDLVDERRGKAVGRASADVRGLRGFLARHAVAFCGSDDTVVPERRCAAGRGGGRPVG